METIKELKSRIQAIQWTLEYEVANDRSYTHEYKCLYKEMCVLMKTLKKLQKIYK